MENASFQYELWALMQKVACYTEGVYSSFQRDWIQIKDDRSPVTLADYGAQVIIAKWLSKNFPEDTLIAEEGVQGLAEPSSTPLRERLIEALSRFYQPLKEKDVLHYLDYAQTQSSPDVFWVLDPLDGTRGFLRGDQYAIALARIIRGEIDIAGLACPRLKMNYRGKSLLEECFFYASKDQGAWLTSLQNGMTWLPIHVSECRDITCARMLHSFESAHTDPEKMDNFVQSLGISQCIPVDSQVKYGLLACGDAELFLRFPPQTNPDYKEKIWDHASGVLLLHEAGGKVTDIYGNPFQFKLQTYLDTVGVFASNGHLHDLGLATLQQIIGER